MALLKLILEGTLDEVKTYVKDNPESVQEKDAESGHLVIHEALADDLLSIPSPMYLEKRAFILKEHPLSTFAKDNDGMLPLHYAAKRRNSLDILRLLIEAAPIATLVVDNDGNLPIHAAVSNGDISTESLDLLFDANPQGLSALTSNGMSALQLACCASKNMTHSTVQWVIKKCPVSIGAFDANQDYMLHNAAHHAANVVDALTAEKKDGNLPLHLSVMIDDEETDVANVKFLLKQYREGARRVDAKGQLPLHAACACETVPIEAIDLLVQHYPEGLAQYDKDGLLPFHYACTVPILEHVTAMLNSSILPSSKENLPALLVACDRDAPLEVIMKLVERSKELFSGKIGKISNVVERCQAVAGNGPKRRKLCMGEDI